MAKLEQVSTEQTAAGGRKHLVQDTAARMRELIFARDEGEQIGSLPELAKNLGVGVLESMDAVLVPGGFGKRGIEGKIVAAQYAREHGIPYLGICLGMQVATIEYARHMAGLEGANSTEFEPATPHPVIALIDEWQDADGTINPNNSTNVPGMHLLASADLVIDQFRWRELPDTDMKHFVDYVNSGKPMIVIRTGTHSFKYSRNLAQSSESLTNGIFDAERKRQEHELRYLSEHDVLTGLANRRQLGVELVRRVAERRRHGQGVGIAILGTLGHCTHDDRIDCW